MAGLPSEASLNELGRVAVSLQENFQALRGECNNALQLVARRTLQLHEATERSLHLAQFVTELGAVLERFNVPTDVSELTDVAHPPVEGAVEDLRQRLDVHFAQCEADVEAILSQVGKFVLVANFSQGVPTPGRAVSIPLPVTTPQYVSDNHDGGCASSLSELRPLQVETGGERAASAEKPGIDPIPLPVEIGEAQDGDTYCIDDNGDLDMSDGLQRGGDSGLMFFEMSPATNSRKTGNRAPIGRRAAGALPASPRRTQGVKSRNTSSPGLPHTPGATQRGLGSGGQTADRTFSAVPSSGEAASENSPRLTDHSSPLASSTPTTALKEDVHTEGQSSAAESTSGGSGERHLVLRKTSSISLGLRICGGRGTGVFVVSVAPGSGAAQSGVRAQEQLLSFNGSDFTCITHSIAGRAMLGLSGDVRVVVKANQQGYDHLPRGADTQDHFFIRTRFSRPPGSKKSLQDLPFAVGDVFLVTETAPHAHDKAWKANQVVIATGAPKEKSGYVPSFSRAVHMHQASAGKTGGADGLLSYEVVVPSKVRSPRPVILLGGLQNVTSLRSHLLKEQESVFTTCPVYDVIGQQDMRGRDDIVLLTSTQDLNRQVYVYKTSLQQAAEKGLHCLLDVPAQDVSGLIVAGIHPVVVLLLKNKTVVAAREEYGLLWLNTGNVTLSGVTRRDGQAVLRIVQEQQQNVVWMPHPIPLTAENS